LPSERTIRDILNRMNYRLKRIQKGKPLKKTKDTDTIFDNVKAARETYADDPQTLEISVDTKAKVSLGEYALGEKTRTDSQGNVTKGWDHDPPAKEKLVPWGVLILLTGGLTLIFGRHETSDFWGDCLRVWWKRQRHGESPIGVIVPKNEMKELNKRLERSELLGKYDLIIRPLKPRGR